MTVICSILVWPEEYRCADFLGDNILVHSVFSDSWYDCGDIIMSVYGDVGDFTYFFVRVDSDPVIRFGLWFNFTHFLHEGGLGVRLSEEFHTFS